MRANYWFLMILMLVVAVTAIFMLGSGRDGGTERATGRMPAGGPSETPAQAATRQGMAIPPPELDLVPEQPQSIVDSFAPESHVALSHWRAVGGSAGHFDRLDLLGGVAVPDSGVSPDDILIAQGWAGDPELGLRLKDVLLVRCQRIVARTQVTLERADVAKAVHPNLLRSGWEAQLFAGDLPACGDDHLSAWAVLPGNPALLISLIGQHPVAVAGREAPAVTRVSAQDVPRPDAYPPPPAALFDILASRANLRKCGSTRCPVVAQIDRGTHAGVVLEDNGTWSLVAFGDRQGWLFNELFAPVQF